ncbi:uncharacterized protein ASCRUDRAFT_8749 [Ascoidea rubescens DSM 1968]|uniref:Uncharacterized protein n=1 Tax=Ascoidea rubescens DSM 1968 TaxID=1344418 RepID=A0A1D2VFU4_9ASCO|nr:hypothetical protein ASCRUDRAFT_8749 [Ascoidea rubescens DSM 1968]ODV60548.1 hypothetical protein ASCRUDRAFT_8749 [Ascoidea rubescens DSM 1968]
MNDKCKNTAIPSEKPSNDDSNKQHHYTDIRSNDETMDNSVKEIDYTEEFNTIREHETARNPFAASAMSLLKAPEVALTTAFS